MKFSFLFGGGKFDVEIAPLAESFRGRVSRYSDTEVILISDRAKDPSADISKHIRTQDFVLLFDERGKEITSEKYADLLDQKIQSGAGRAVLIVGGAFGVSDAVRERADATIAFSKMIFPHQLARIMVLEQTYRALSILAGSKYHHG